MGGLEAKGAEQYWVVGADFVNSRYGGVVGRVVMGAEYCWIVGGGGVPFAVCAGEGASSSLASLSPKAILYP